MHKRALLISGTALSLLLALAGCGEGHGLLGPDTVADMNKDDGVQYGALWKPCGTIGDRSKVELLADGKTWVVDRNADVNGSADKKHPVKLKVNSKGTLEVLGFSYGAKAGRDSSSSPEDEHRVAVMKVSAATLPMESLLDKKPKSCNKATASPSPTSKRRPAATPSGTPMPSSTKFSKSPTPTATKTRKSGSGGGSSTGSGTKKTCKTVNDKKVCS